ncbi:hypothetical protein BGX30_013625 [Mortierella sp. GBA39]|nr:hypothetical protein BGX30_013625 [Mortierella sp. GBA39]
MTSDRYKGVRPIAMGVYDGQRLVIGTADADLLVTSSVRLDLRDAAEALVPFDSTIEKVYMPYTIYTVFDKMMSNDGCGYAGTGLFRLLGEKMVPCGAKKIAKPTLPVSHVREFRKRCKEGTAMATLFNQLLELFSIRGGGDEIEILYNESLNDVLEKIAELLAPIITISNKTAAQYVTQQALRGVVTN